MGSLAKDAFELTRRHCKDAGRMAEMRAEPWYQFARLIRNYLAHKFLFEFNSHDIRLLPVTWRGRTITAAMNGEELPVAIFGWSEAWALFIDIRTFAERTGV